MEKSKSWTSRTELMIGKDACGKLKDSCVAVFGVGGVGGFAVEALARAGVGKLVLIDNDEVDITNINRQIIALHSTVGMNKVDAARQRILDINPEAVVEVHKVFYLPDTAGQFDFSQYDYVVDAIDTVSGKIMLVMAAKEAGVPIISSMGAGNKLDPTKFEVSDIYKTSVCPLARTMRRELKKRGIDSLKVVYSREEPVRGEVSDEADTKGNCGRPAPGSISFVPSVAGLIIAGEVIKDLSGINKG